MVCLLYTSQAIYSLNLGEIDKRDILSVGEDEIPDGDILTAGFPCQPFSNAGNRKGVHDSRGMLYKELSLIHIYCADCGKRLSYSSPQSQHRPDGKTYDADSSFRCPTYKSMYGECTMHYIKSSTLDKLVDEAVRKIARYVLRNEQAFLEQVRVLTSADQKHTQSERCV